MLFLKKVEEEMETTKENTYSQYSNNLELFLGIKKRKFQFLMH